jgi:hypothetical protein
LFAALSLAATPGFVEQARRRRLPDGVLEVIKIAAGCEETLAEVARLTSREPAEIRAAAEFYVREALLFEGADSRRVLGVRAEADREQMRRHMSWLMRWLHPDRAATADLDLARRVLEAWRDSASGPPPADAPRPIAAPHVAGRRRRHPIGRQLLALLAALAVFYFIESQFAMDAADQATADEASGGFR